MNKNTYKLLLIYQDCIELPEFLLCESTLGVEILKCPSKDIDIIEEISEEVDICLLWCWETTQEIFNTLKKKKNISWIHTIWTGLDHLNFNDWNEDIIITNSSGVSSSSLAEFALASSLYFLKNFETLSQNKKNKLWKPIYNEKLSNKNIGILGYGSIGQAVENVFSTACKNIFIYTNGSPNINYPSSSQTSLSDLFKLSDIVICSLPLTKDTEGLIGWDYLRLLNDNAILINLSRGKIICENSLLNLLTNKKIRGASLDVFCHEPLPSSHPFWELDNIIISPHSADKTKDKYLNYAKTFMDNLDLYLSNSKLNNEVNLELGY